MPASSFDFSSFSVWYADPFGTRLFPIDVDMADLQYVKNINGIGWFKGTFAFKDFDLDLLKPDYQIQIFRKPAGGVSRIDFLGFLRQWKANFNNGKETIELQGPDQNDLLRRRIVAYASGTEEAIAGGLNVGDVMKDVFNNNFIGGAVAARDLSGLGVEVASDLGDGPTVEKGFAWRNTLDVISELNKMSKANDDEIFFSLEVDSIKTNANPQKFIFTTYTGQPGTDKTATIVLSPDWGVIDQVEVFYDYYSEINYVFGGGQGEGSDREIQEVSDSDLVGASPFGRIEAFKDARNEETTAGVLDAAQDLLSSGQPRVFFRCSLLDIADFRYGSDWFLGDKVTASIYGKFFEGIIKTVSVRLDPSGKETITAKLEADGVVQ